MLMGCYPGKDGGEDGCMEDGGWKGGQTDGQMHEQAHYVIGR